MVDTVNLHAPIHLLLNAVAANTNGVAVQPQKALEGVAQVQGTTWGGGAVAIQGRLSPDAGWEDIVTFTANGLSGVRLCPYMRAEFTGRVAETAVSAWLFVK